MGQRANLVIVRQGDWRLYYDHWCANRLDVELFWGPRLAAELIEQREPLDDRRSWLDEVWCEGAAVLDEDRQVLLWFGGEDVLYDIPLRRAFLGLMRCQWPGWEVRWAGGHIVEIGGYLGLPADLFLAMSEPEEGFTLLTDFPEDNDTLLTVRWQGRCLAAQIDGDEEALQLGPVQLDFLRDTARAPSLRWTGTMPTGGVHLDLDARTLHAWRANPVAALAERVRRSWPGWRTHWLEDRFEEHLRLAEIDIRLPKRHLASLQKGELRRLRKHCTHEGSNPARGLAERLEATYINPWTDEDRSSAGTEAEKLQILDALAARLPIRAER